MLGMLSIATGLPCGVGPRAPFKPLGPYGPNGATRWSPWAAYLAAVPLAIAVLWNLYENLAALLPNLY